VRQNHNETVTLPGRTSRLSMQNSPRTSAWRSASCRLQSLTDLRIARAGRQ